MPVVHAERLREFARSILEATGTPEELARIVGDSLVDANLAGHDSHGMLRIVQYVRFARAGHVQPAARACVVARRGATARVDGAWGWGQPAMTLASETAVELASEFGIGAVVVHRCFHIGRAAPYVELAARAGMVALTTVSAGPAVAPYGGRTRVLGTNPVAWAVPRGHDQDPLSFDIATSGVAEGKLQVARAKGEPAPPGCVLDVNGQPSLDPEDFYAGGSLLPFGGHKGYGFGVLAHVLGRALVGVDSDRYPGPPGTNGPVMIALNPAYFGSFDEFSAEVAAQCDVIASAPPAEGVKAVLLPGDPEIASRRRREAEGIPIPDRTWNELTALAAELGIEVGN
ncbi:MAG: Ldh family oxidoreductase [Thermomicrobiales bacterium]